MTLIVYVYAKCSTCQNALRFLEQNKIAFVSKEITKTPPSVEELNKMLSFQQNVRKLFNTSGLLYKELRLSQKLPEMSLTQSLELLTTHGMLVKRPFLLGTHIGLLGFKEEEWKTALLKVKVL